MNGKYIQQNAAAVEASHKGYIAVAGPYVVNHQTKAVAKSERATCVRSHRDQKAACPKARIVMHGSQAWIIRKLPMVSETIQKTRIVASGDLGIKGGRAFV